MEFPAFNTAAGGVFVLLAIAVVWLAFRLKLKNELLKETISELHSRNKKRPVTNDPKPAPASTPQKHSGFADAFLWKEDTEHGQPSAAGRMLDENKLRRLLETETRFTGLVVLIGIDAEVRQTAEHERVMQSAEECVATLLGNNDMGCRSGHHEILMICPGARGGEAQRRLNEISERLWKFQLDGRGAFSILFSWGGIGVDRQPLSDAVASAMDRLQQAKRSRKLFYVHSKSAKRRRAV